jgi:RimJ/RimL family protein N-acetyltransferase
MAEHTWSIVLRGTGAMIGMISLRISPPGAEFGFVVAKSFWNNGYATEAARAVLEWALSQESIRRVSAVCEVGNAASARVLEKLGAQRKGTLRRWMRHAGSDIPQDCHCYATLKEDLVQ